MTEPEQQERSNPPKAPAWHSDGFGEPTRTKMPGKAQTAEFLRTFSKEVSSLPELGQPRPSRLQGLRSFRGRAVDALGLIFREKEIIVFSLLQAAAIGGAYFLWVPVLGWLPEEAWSEERGGLSMYDLQFIGWSALCVGLAAFFIGIFSGCIGVVHVLHRRGERSTVAKCLKVVMPQGLRLWLFHWIDGFITCQQILNRLPKKDDNTTPAQRALREALYYAWKVGSIGFLPGLVMGKTLFEAGKESLTLVQRRFPDIALLRAGYSAACWVIGLLTYLGGAFFLIKAGFVDLEPGASTGAQVQRFFLGAGIPVLFSVAVIQVFVRPVFLISLCDIYAEFVREHGEEPTSEKPPGSRL